MEEIDEEDNQLNAMTQLVDVLDKMLYIKRIEN